MPGDYKLNINNGEGVTYNIGGVDITIKRAGNRAFVEYKSPDGLILSEELSAKKPVTIGRNQDNRIAIDKNTLSRAGNRVELTESGELVLITTDNNKPLNIHPDRFQLEPPDKEELKARPREVPEDQKIANRQLSDQEQPAARERLREIDRLLQRLRSPEAQRRVGQAQGLGAATLATPESQIKRGEIDKVALDGFRDLIESYRLLHPELSKEDNAQLVECYEMLDQLARDERIPDREARARKQAADLKREGERYVAAGHEKHNVTVKIQSDKDGGYTVTTYNAGDEAWTDLPGTKRPSSDDVVVMRRQKLKTGINPDYFIDLLNQKREMKTDDPRYKALSAEVEACLERVNVRDKSNYEWGPQQHKGDCTERSPEEAIRHKLPKPLFKRLMDSIFRQSARQGLETPAEMVEALRAERKAIAESFPEGKRPQRSNDAIDYDQRVDGAKQRAIEEKQRVEMKKRQDALRLKLDELGVSGRRSEMVSQAELQIGKLLSDRSEPENVRQEKIKTITDSVRELTGQEVKVSDELVRKYRQAVSQAKKSLGLNPDAPTPSRDEVTRMAVEKAVAHIEKLDQMSPSGANGPPELIPSEVTKAVNLLGGDKEAITLDRLAEIYKARKAKAISPSLSSSRAGEVLKIPVPDPSRRNEQITEVTEKLNSLGIHLEEGDLLKVRHGDGSYHLELSAKASDQLREIAGKDFVSVQKFSSVQEVQRAINTMPTDPQQRASQAARVKEWIKTAGSDELGEVFKQTIGSRNEEFAIEILDTRKDSLSNDAIRDALNSRAAAGDVDSIKLIFDKAGDRISKQDVRAALQKTQENPNLPELFKEGGRETLEAQYEQRLNLNERAAWHKERESQVRARPARPAGGYQNLPLESVIKGMHDQKAMAFNHTQRGGDVVQIKAASAEKAADLAAYLRDKSSAKSADFRWSDSQGGWIVQVNLKEAERAGLLPKGVTAANAAEKLSDPASGKFDISEQARRAEATSGRRRDYAFRDRAPENSKPTGTGRELAGAEKTEALIKILDTMPDGAARDKVAAALKDPETLRKIHVYDTDDVGNLFKGEKPVNQPGTRDRVRAFTRDENGGEIHIGTGGGDPEGAKIAGQALREELGHLDTAMHGRAALTHVFEEHVRGRRASTSLSGPEVMAEVRKDLGLENYRGADLPKEAFDRIKAMKEDGSWERQSEEFKQKYKSLSESVDQAMKSGARGTPPAQPVALTPELRPAAEALGAQLGGMSAEEVFARGYMGSDGQPNLQFLEKDYPEVAKQLRSVGAATDPAGEKPSAEAVKGAMEVAVSKDLGLQNAAQMADLVNGKSVQIKDPEAVKSLETLRDAGKLNATVTKDADGSATVKLNGKDANVNLAQLNEINKATGNVASGAPSEGRVVRGARGVNRGLGLMMGLSALPNWNEMDFRQKAQAVAMPAADVAGQLGNSARLASSAPRAAQVLRGAGNFMGPLVLAGGVEELASIGRYDSAGAKAITAVKGGATTVAGGAQTVGWIAKGAGYAKTAQTANTIAEGAGGPLMIFAIADQAAGKILLLDPNTKRYGDWRDAGHSATGDIIEGFERIAEANKTREGMDKAGPKPDVYLKGDNGAVAPVPVEYKNLSRAMHLFEDKSISYLDGVADQVRSSKNPLDQHWKADDLSNMLDQAIDRAEAARRNASGNHREQIDDQLKAFKAAREELNHEQASEKREDNKHVWDGYRAREAKAAKAMATAEREWKSGVEDFQSFKKDYETISNLARFEKGKNQEVEFEVTDPKTGKKETVIGSRAEQLDYIVKQRYTTQIKEMLAYKNGSAGARSPEQIIKDNQELVKKMGMSEGMGQMMLITSPQQLEHILYKYRTDDGKQVDMKNDLGIISPIMQGNLTQSMKDGKLERVKMPKPDAVSLPYGDYRLDDLNDYVKVKGADKEMVALLKFHGIIDENQKPDAKGDYVIAWDKVKPFLTKEVEDGLMSQRAVVITPEASAAKPAQPKTQSQQAPDRQQKAEAVKEIEDILKKSTTGASREKGSSYAMHGDTDRLVAALKKAGLRENIDFKAGDLSEGGNSGKGVLIKNEALQSLGSTIVNHILRLPDDPAARIARGPVVPGDSTPAGQIGSGGGLAVASHDGRMGAAPQAQPRFQVMGGEAQPTGHRIRGDGAQPAKPGGVSV
jgi:hypothetical protein